MTESELVIATERLETIHKQFANMVLMLMESFKKIKEYLESYATSFEANLNSYYQTTELLRSYSVAMRELQAAMESVVKIAGENNLAINETNERMRELITRFDSYFGDASGLEHNN